MSRRTACTRSRVPRRSPATPAGIAWKLQGTDPDARVFVVVSLQPARSAARRHGKSLRRNLWPRTRREGVELFNPHPESLAEIAAEYPALQWRYEGFRQL